MWKTSTGASAVNTRTHGGWRVPMCIALVGACSAVVVAALPVSALNGRSFTLIRSADRQQFCIDSDNSEAPDFAKTQLWNCTNGPEQRFRRIDGVLPNGSQIQIQRENGHYCLTASQLVADEPIVARLCSDANLAAEQGWIQHDDGTLTNASTGLCVGFDSEERGALVVLKVCDGSISQDWFL